MARLGNCPARPVGFLKDYALHRKKWLMKSRQGCNTLS